MFEHRAAAGLYKAAMDPGLLRTNTEVYCENYLDGDFNYDMQQLVTKVRGGAWGLRWAGPGLTSSS